MVHTGCRMKPKPVPCASPIVGPAPQWINETTTPSLGAEWQRDAGLLCDLMGVQRLPDGHPVRLWWDNCATGNRFRIHHLADDLRRITDIDGAPSLIRQLRSNSVGFSDFRFELHLAGALARSSEQVLLRLGGDKSGPDVEARVKSGHLCGFACFRAASNAPAILALQSDLRAFVRGLATTVLARSTTSQTIVINFPKFPLRPEDPGVARRALRQLLTETDKSELQVDGCHLFRKGPPPRDVSRQTQKVRLRLQVPVPSWEKERVYWAIVDKIERECSAWAGAYPGLPILAIEESVFGQDLSAELKRLMSTSRSFVGAIAVYPTIRPDGAGIPHGLEDIVTAFRPDTNDLCIGLETFGDNVRAWTEGFASVAQIPSSIREEWDIVRSPFGNSVHLVRPTSLERLYARVPYTDPRKPVKDDAAVERLIAAALKLFEWSEEVR